jgi:hypothetical protein
MKTASSLFVAIILVGYPAHVFAEQSFNLHKIKIQDKEFRGKYFDKIIINNANEDLYILLREKDTGDSNIKKLYAFNVDGLLKCKSPTFTGKYLFLKSKNTFFIWGHEFDSIEKYAYLWSPLLNRLIKIEQRDNPISAGTFGDGEFYWIQYYYVKNGKDAIRINVFDANGNCVDEQSFVSASKYEFKGNKNFAAVIPKPEFPY